jgi:hypothetical protein
MREKIKSGYALHTRRHILWCVLSADDHYQWRSDVSMAYPLNQKSISERAKSEKHTKTEATAQKTNYILKRRDEPSMT